MYRYFMYKYTYIYYNVYHKIEVFEGKRLKLPLQTRKAYFGTGAAAASALRIIYLL